jgi:hypothetical protein
VLQIVSTSIRIKRGQWKNDLIKDDISRNIDTIYGWIETFKTLMHVATAEKNTRVVEQFRGYSARNP